MSSAPGKERSAFGQSFLGEGFDFLLASSLFVPAVAFFLGTHAKNKIEGFAFLKGGAIVIFLPVLALLEVFQKGYQYLLGILPNFWTVKAMMNAAIQHKGPSDLPFYGYILVGTVYYALIFVYTFRKFLKKNQDDKNRELFSVFYSLIGNLSHRHGKHEADSRFFIAFQDCFDFPHDSFQLFFLQNEKMVLL